MTNVDKMNFKMIWNDNTKIQGILSDKMTEKWL